MPASSSRPSPTSRAARPASTMSPARSRWRAARPGSATADFFILLSRPARLRRRRAGRHGPDGFAAFGHVTEAWTLSGNLRRTGFRQPRGWRDEGPDARPPRQDHQGRPAEVTCSAPRQRKAPPRGSEAGLSRSAVRRPSRCAAGSRTGGTAAGWTGSTPASLRPRPTGWPVPSCPQPSDQNRLTKNTATPGDRDHVADRRDVVPFGEGRRVVGNAPRHAVEPEEVHREEDDVHADEHQEEVNLAEKLVVHPAAHLREPEVEAGEQAEHRPRLST